MNIVVASVNPVKIATTRNGFEKMFPNQALSLRGISVPSGVSDQPFSSHETLTGAINRANNARLQCPEAEFWVGIEGGIEPENGGNWMAFAWVVILSRDQIGKARTGSFILPMRVCHLIQKGLELGDADDIVFGRSNSKQENGAVGILTADALNRTSLYEQAVIMALIPFKNPDLYPTEDLPA